MEERTNKGREERKRGIASEIGKKEREEMKD